MEFPKLVIASNGRCTAALLDGVFFGQGIQRLDFSTDDKGGEKSSTIRIMELDVGSVSLEHGEEKFAEFLEGMAKEDNLLEEFTKK